ncbi:hypothetical protein NM688_g6288 [Phlebia brevispora]|uniref:Uncharacterized protein n=1 Tax=Phlebia brevispora TaxID=194682 RepID=A0ACC1SHQ4_9APHY|nr:hypothetical protein NM688_g6288 [Phlebia brevispora]
MERYHVRGSLVTISYASWPGELDLSMLQNVWIFYGGSSFLMLPGPFPGLPFERTSSLPIVHNHAPVGDIRLLQHHLKTLLCPSLRDSRASRAEAFKQTFQVLEKALRLPYVLCAAGTV